jgi:sugar/nucleoside kinase (ribokinase family)
MFDIVTFGSATYDISVQMPDSVIEKDRRFISGAAYCLNLGSKIDVTDMHFGFGGGGINTATTFKKQGFKVAYCGTVGNDIPGQEIIEYLDGIGVVSKFVRKTKNKWTNNSLILDNPKQDRTVLAYRGASELFSKKDIDKELLAKWFYLAPLSGKLSSITEDVISFALKNRIKIAANFGNSQLRVNASKMKSWLSKIDVLILNKEEAALLSGIDYGNEQGIIRKIAEMHNGISVITKGKEGVVVIGGDKIYEAELDNFKVIDETGAGDAFGSGFISGLIKTKEIESAIRLGLVNSKYAISTLGATTGLLSEKDKKLVEKEKIKVSVRNI